MKTEYEILHDDYEGKGPYSGEEVEAMVQSGEIGGEQKVRKVHSGKVIVARAALLSAQANEQQGPKEPTRKKFFIGAVMLVVGLAATAFVFYAKTQGETRARGLLLIPGALVVIGANLMVTNAKALRAQG